ncbi:MAG: gamma-glutamylcyclotransferase [Hyphomicrobiaceae bacterium]
MPEQNWLFVYGTLRPDARVRLGARQRARLRAAGWVLGAAVVDGRLVDLGGYPGLIVPTGQERRGRSAGPARTRSARGVAMVLRAPAVLLPLLDRYEGIGGLVGLREYVRIELPIVIGPVPRRSGARRGTAWAYICADQSPRRSAFDPRRLFSRRQPT